MLRYQTLLESAIGASFILDPALNPDDYEITNSMRDLDRWRARVFLSNNSNEDITGQMDEVGYTMISKTNNYIIPIARADEHHRGGDLLHWFRDSKRLKIKINDYIPLFNGNNYIYSMTDVPDMLNVISKFLSYGAPESMIIGAYGDVRNIAMTTKQFVASGGDVIVKPGTLAPLGKALIEDYQACAEALAQCRRYDQRSLRGRAFQTAIGVIRRMITYKFSLMMHLDLKDIDKTLVEINDLRMRDDVKGLEQLMFGHNSLKNVMHMSMKQYQAKREAGDPGLWDDKVNAMWGNLPMAIDVLARF